MYGFPQDTPHGHLGFVVRAHLRHLHPCDPPETQDRVEVLRRTLARLIAVFYPLDRACRGHDMGLLGLSRVAWCHRRLADAFEGFRGLVDKTDELLGAWKFLTHERSGVSSTRRTIMRTAHIVHTASDPNSLAAYLAGLPLPPPILASICEVERLFNTWKKEFWAELAQVRKEGKPSRKEIKKVRHFLKDNLQEAFESLEKLASASASSWRRVTTLSCKLL